MPAARDPEGLPEPPGPPKLPRRIRLYGSQWIGIPILLLLPPVLAMMGVFGESRAGAQADAGALRVHVDYPDRLRKGQNSEIEIRVRNQSAAPLDSVTVTFEPAYLQRFHNVRITPPPSSGREVVLTQLQPGADALVYIQLEGERPWRIVGRIGAQAGADTVLIEISTLVFP